MSLSRIGVFAAVTRLAITVVGMRRVCRHRGGAFARGPAIAARPTAAAGNAGELSRSRRGKSATTDPCGVTACGAQSGSGADHVHRARHVPDRESGTGADRHRLQRLCAPAGSARHRHHEPRTRHPLHRPSRSRDQTRAARLGAEPGTAGGLGSEISRRAGAQRADQYPQLERRHRALRQFDLHFRDRQSMHRASRASASHA